MGVRRAVRDAGAQEQGVGTELMLASAILACGGARDGDPHSPGGLAAAAASHGPAVAWALGNGKEVPDGMAGAHRIQEGRRRRDAA